MRSGWWWQILWVGIAVICLTRFIPVVQQAAVRPSHGFHSYYTASRLLVDGVPVAQFYDNEWFRAVTRRIQPGANDIFTPNLPVTAYLFLPLAQFDYTIARIIWTVLGLLIFVGAVVCTIEVLEFPKRYWLLAFIIALLYQPLYAQLVQGQAYLLLTGLLVVAWLGYRNQQPHLVGIAFGLMFSFKSAGSLFFVLLLFQNRWRSLAWAIGTVGFTTLITLPRVTIKAWFAYIEGLREFSSQPFTMSVGYQSLASVLKRLFIADSQWNPQPLFDAPMLGLILPLAGTLLLVGFSICALRRSLDGDLAFAMFTTAGIIISPFSGDYHYLLLLLPIAILTVRLDTGWRQWLLLFAIGLIGVHFDLTSLLQLHPLLAYPKLYGALILWWLALSPGTNLHVAEYAVR